MFSCSRLQVFFSELTDMFCFAILCVFLFCVPQVGRPQFICGVELLSLAGALKSDRRLFLQSEGCKSNMPGLQRIWNIVLMSWLFSKKGALKDLLPVFSMFNAIIASQSLLFDEIIVLLNNDTQQSFLIFTSKWLWNKSISDKKVSRIAWAVTSQRS